MAPYVQRNRRRYEWTVVFPDLDPAAYIAAMVRGEYGVTLLAVDGRVQICVEGATEGAAFRVQPDQRVYREFHTAELVIAHFADCLPGLRRQMQDRPGLCCLMVGAKAFTAYDIRDRAPYVIQRVQELE
jgi:hypothetical protein